MDFKQFLKDYGYTIKSFAEKYNIKKRTVENWCYRSCPEYLISAFVRYEDLLIDYNKLKKDYIDVYERLYQGGVPDD